ncbi:LuxR family transcriptional activator of conjugal transfer of Ti plasmids [Bradyrhizobium japonicum]|nr:LuxR family transcriptional regulator [Bradyrhizobium japonicum]MCS3989537.1 DNA-binding CsgD family transcriptional regulator [Bradyrhizobium japonicum]MCS4015647.1 DNA-binding CsgD family transcriptional regulator [Bradyrhizobium japonicum]MCS4202743.1 DNA-binding CsgD family transcriptional regulator [Bradyrhizobium japonicum]MDH6175608.1 LuxR family transcriptional activator of conjugal transfer of Ti plasmids [Bradyrhizobium japonicum]
MLAAAKETDDFSQTMVVTAKALDLSCFAYLALPQSPHGRPELISNYPTDWTSHYLESRYQRIDPVIQSVLTSPEPFRWGFDLSNTCHSTLQQQMLDEASQFGIRCGFTIPIHDGRSPIAALTFASDQRSGPFETCVAHQSRVLQLMALYFHAHVRRKSRSQHEAINILLSVREYECLEWAAQGKTAWEIGQIVGISRHTAASYLRSAKQKLGVRTVVQAALLLAAGKLKRQN